MLKKLPGHTLIFLDLSRVKLRVRFHICHGFERQSGRIYIKILRYPWEANLTIS